MNLEIGTNPNPGTNPVWHCITAQYMLVQTCRRLKDSPLPWGAYNQNFQQVSPGLPLTLLSYGALFLFTISPHIFLQGKVTCKELKYKNAPQINKNKRTFTNTKKHVLLHPIKRGASRQAKNGLSFWEQICICLALESWVFLGRSFRNLGNGENINE